MKAILVFFDSLSKEFLPPYGNDWVQAPHFKRLAERSVTFDNCFVGSMPCMPARRELHTGRYNFLHRAWGPLEPFDTTNTLGDYEIEVAPGTYVVAMEQRDGWQQTLPHSTETQTPGTHTVMVEVDQALESLDFGTVTWNLI